MPLIRTAEELAQVADPAWPALYESFTTTGPATRVLPADPERARQVLYRLQVSATSVLGAMALNCGGVIAGKGWLRLLGAGYERLPDLAQVNDLGDPVEASAPPPSLIVGYDVLGGRFAVDGGGLALATGQVCYFGPDSLNWVGIGVGHGAFVTWACSGDADQFYRDLRWTEWEREVGQLRLDEGLAFYPPLFTAQAHDPGACERRAIPMKELLAFYDGMAVQVGGLPDGGGFEFRITE